MKDNPKINLQIAQLRKSKGITQSTLADALSISFQSVSKWENGTAYPDITLLPAISRYFGVSVDYLLGLHESINIIKKFFIAADQGGTKTHIRLCRLSGEIISEIKCEGACWFYDGIDKAIGFISDGINKLKAQTGIMSEQIAFTICGAAGINWDDEREMFTEALFEKTRIISYIYNDCAAAVYCDGLDYENRIVLCAGTEFDAAVITPGLKMPFVYCNYTLPCDMGGSEIGRMAVNAVIRAEEMLAAKTSLKDKLLSYFEYDDIETLHTAFRRGKLSKPAKGLVSVVFGQANKGDKASLAILRRLATNMCSYVKAAALKYGLAEKKTAIILAGGIFKNECSEFYDEINKQVYSVCKNAVIIKTQHDPVDGAYNIGILKSRNIKGEKQNEI